MLLLPRPYRLEFRPWLGHFQAHVAYEAAVSPTGGLEPFGDRIKIGMQPLGRWPALIAKRLLHDCLGTLVISVEDRSCEDLFRPKMVREAASRNAGIAGDLADAGAGEAPLMQGPHAGLDDRGANQTAPPWLRPLNIRHRQLLRNRGGGLGQCFLNRRSRALCWAVTRAAASGRSGSNSAASG
jgi:hypothetical protein